MHRIIICGGGTAGHIYPAISVIEYINGLDREVKILYVGSKKGMEKDLIPALGVDFRGIMATGLTASPSLSKKFFSYMRFIFFTFIGFLQALKIMSGFKPLSVLGMGGYVCGPTLLAALVLKKGIFLHEQNFIPGRLNKVFSKFARKTFVSFRESAIYFNVPKDRIIYSGNPVRKIIRDTKQKVADFKKWGLDEEKFTLTAFGGSLGAQKINESVTALCKTYDGDAGLQIILICGKRFYKDILKMKERRCPEKDKVILKAFPYIDEMDEIYALSDLIISRSGANTIAELIKTNIPAILVPYPKAIDNHQYFNAKYLEEKGKAFIVLDNDLNEQIISDKINTLIKNGKKNYNEIRKKSIEDYKINSPDIITDYLIGGSVEKRK
jgi:UDP-N-acetylglucosamine--N-acetylmuramyl-(pentapeptide) pyrophosphoryl-undecaprenol N-acetylglucosamine transferase